MANSEALMATLRRQTEEYHRKVERLPFVDAVMSGSLPLTSYVGFLRAMAVVTAVSEHELSRTPNPILNAVWEGSRPKLPLIQQDLAFFEPRRVPDIARASDQALALAGAVRRWSVQEPLALLGCRYVLEGSMLGAQVLRPRLARTLGLVGDEGLAYLSTHESDPTALWKRFSRRVNAQALAGADRDRVVMGACETFQGLARILAALYPVGDASPLDSATTVNPEAGMHRITADPRELLAALDAGSKSWDAYPYFAWRFGERGERFTRSDSAWLVTVTDMPEATALQQVRWLGRLLSVRGMPRYLLQHHLENLHEALVQAVPERRDRYRKLRAAVEDLQASRRQVIDDARFVALAEDFDRQVGPSWSSRLAGTGRILVSAVADERAGIPGAVESLEAWMTDPSRFPQPWITAVRQLLARARAGGPET